MKMLFFTLGLIFCLGARAQSTYKCGAFKDQQGLSLIGLEASITEDDQEQISLNVWKKFGIESNYKLVSTNKGPVFNLFTYRAGPYKVFYNQDLNKFTVQTNAFRSTCKEAR